jgi:ankyrin repeat protein
LTGFEFRVNEVRQRLQRLTEKGGAEARLKKEKDSQGTFWKKAHSVEGYVEAQVKKVEAVLLRHRERAAADYSDDDVYRTLVSESLQAARMAESAVLLWLRDKGQFIHLIEGESLLECQRRFESFLMLECRRSSEAGAHCAAVVELCRSRNLLRVDASERDENGETGLMALAARGGSADDVRLLVAAGADVGAVDTLGQSAMYLAAQQGHAGVVEALARAGADCNQVDTGGTTPLRIGSSNGHLRCVEFLLKQGADVNKVTNDGNTPLFMASQNGYCDVVEALLRGGADVNKARNDGATPLIMASEDGHCDVVEALLRGGADVNKAFDGDTPLIIASQMGHRDVVEALLRGGADVNRARNDGGTPVLISSQHGHAVILGALLAAGGDVSKTLTSGPNKGASALWLAAFSAHSECLLQLLAADCDVNACTDDGRSPLDIATAGGHADMVQQLLLAGATLSRAAAASISSSTQ